MFHLFLLLHTGAFAIWAPIYLGESAFVASQFFASDTTLSALNAALPSVTVPFVAANLMQSLWCASFRPSYEGWKKYIRYVINFFDFCQFRIRPLILCITTFQCSYAWRYCLQPFANHRSCKSVISSVSSDSALWMDLGRNTSKLEWIGWI